MHAATLQSNDELAAPSTRRRESTEATKIGRPDRYWSGDITYIWTGEGWLYLPSVLDLVSRHVVGWSMSHEMMAQLVIDAFTMAVGPRPVPRGMIAHSDRGSQYASAAFQSVLRKYDVICSRSRRANCCDDPVVESYNATIKTELVHRHNWATRESARAAVYEYIETWYDQQRLHSTLGYLSPVAFGNNTRLICHNSLLH